MDNNEITFGGPVLHHVGIIVPDEAEMDAIIQTLGIRENFRGYVPEFYALCVFTQGNGGSPVEFVIPDGGPLLNFNRGFGGLHHIAYLTPNLDTLAAELAKKGMQFIRPDHVKGAGNFLCNFLSPVYTRGLTIEYVELLG